FTLSLQTFVHAKAAVADMWLVLFVTFAHWAGYELIMQQKRERRTPNAERPTPNEERLLSTSLWWWTFYLSLALAFLAKGPIGWTPLGAVVVARCFRPVPFFARRFLFVRGILLMLALVALWGVPALWRPHGELAVVGFGSHVLAC